MKVALVTDWYLPRVGGIESYLADLVPALSALGHDVHVITSTPGEAEPRVHRLGLPRLPRWDVVASPRAIARLTEILRAERFDVVHGLSLYSPLAHAAMYVGRKLGVPTVLSSHSLLGRAREIACSLWHDAHGWGAWPEVITGVSSLAAEEARRAARRDRGHVLPNGIDLQAWTPPSAPRPEGRPPTVVSVMRLTRRKRPLELVRAIPRIDARLPGARRPRFVFVGDGPLRGDVERLAVRLGVRDRVEVLGARPRADVRAVLSRADVFALPTEQEAFGIAVLEARAMGLPVVARAGCGVGDLVSHGVNGLLAEGPEDFAAHVARLVGDELLRARLAGAARGGLEVFDWPAIAARHLEVYRQAGAPAAKPARRAAA